MVVSLGQGSEALRRGCWGVASSGRARRGLPPFGRLSDRGQPGRACGVHEDVDKPEVLRRTGKRTMFNIDALQATKGRLHPNPNMELPE